MQELRQLTRFSIHHLHIRRDPTLNWFHLGGKIQVMVAGNTLKSYFCCFRPIRFYSVYPNHPQPRILNDSYQNTQKKIVPVPNITKLSLKQRYDRGQRNPPSAASRSVSQAKLVEAMHSSVRGPLGANLPGTPGGSPCAFFGGMLRMVYDGLMVVYCGFMMFCDC